MVSNNNFNCDSACYPNQCYAARGHGNDPKAQYCWGPGTESNPQCQRCESNLILSKDWYMDLILLLFITISFYLIWLPQFFTLNPIIISVEILQVPVTQKKVVNCWIFGYFQGWRMMIVTGILDKLESTFCFKVDV